MAIRNENTNEEQWHYYAGEGDGLLNADNNGLVTKKKVVTAKLIDATIIGLLEDSSNWTNDIYTGTAITDTFEGMYYTKEDEVPDINEIVYYYLCNSDNVWIRLIKGSRYLSYIPKPQIEASKADNGTFIITAKHELIKIYVEAETTTAGNISIGKADGDADVVANTALPTTIGAKELLTIIPLEATTSDRVLYINIDSAATVKLHILTQKVFE